MYIQSCVLAREHNAFDYAGYYNNMERCMSSFNDGGDVQWKYRRWANHPGLICLFYTILITCLHYLPYNLI